MTTGLLQIALRTTDLDASIAYYRDLLGLALLGRFDPPGIAFLDADGVRLMLSPDAASGQLYFRADNLATRCGELEAAGIAFKSDPILVHRDDSGQFGEPGVEEWMRFFDDPADNLLAIVERRPPTR